MRAGGGRYVEDVFSDGRVDRYPVHLSDGRCQSFGVGDRLESGQRPGAALSHEEFLFRITIGQAEFEDEPETVALAFNEWERTGVFERVLSCDHQEWIWQSVGVTVDCDLSFLHRFEGGRLSPRCCPIDLIDQYHVGK